MKINVSWREGVHFRADTPDGQGFDLDGPPHAGGRDLGVRPMEAVLAGVATCSVYDVVHMLEKARASIVSVTVDSEATRVDTIPQVFSSITLKFSIEASGVSEAQVRRMVALSLEKYCSGVEMMRRAGVDVQHELAFRTA